MSQDLGAVHPDSPVSAVTTFDVETAEPSDHLSDVARRMHNHKVGAVFVRMREGGMAILTERDIVRTVASGAESAWAVDCMSRDLVKVPAETTVADAAETLRTANIRHLAVERADGELGIVSIRDLMGPLLDACE